MEGRGDRTKAPLSLQDRRRRIDVKAKAAPSWCFWGLYGHSCTQETLREASHLAKANHGARGLDGVTCEASAASGVGAFLAPMPDALGTRTYHPRRLRPKATPKEGGKGIRRLSMPTIRARVVQGALQLILEPLVAADCQPGSYGSRPQRSAHDAVQRVAEAMVQDKPRVLDVEFQAYFAKSQHPLV